ncbi:MAG: biopolymer transporter ExbD [Chitinivibrionales bacterium]|nr:biopolymer transporter ExbD [Chitinivibrionales bacterium]
MSVERISTKQFHPSDSDTGVHDLDLTPFMSVFIILLPYLITLVVFTQLSILRFSLPPNVGDGLSQMNEKPKIKITVVVAPDFIAITHGEKLLDSIARESDEYDYPLLSQRLTYHRSQVDMQQEAIIAVRDAVKFKYIVRVMDICRETGFEKIGLSQATENASLGS